MVILLFYEGEGDSSYVVWVLIEGTRPELAKVFTMWKVEE